jgi:hypothetical protein
MRKLFRTSAILAAMLMALMSMAPLVQATTQTTTFSNTATFDNITVTVSGNISVDTTAKTVSGTLTVIAVNDTSGQTIFQKTFMFSFSFASTGKTNFILMIPTIGLFLTASCTISASDSTASCVVSKNPDVDHDGIVNIGDLATIALYYKSTNQNYDLNNDGGVGIDDLALVALDYNAPVVF